MGMAALASACGQRGPLYLPTDVPPDQRSTFPQVMVPGMGQPNPSPSKPSPATPNAPAATPP